MNFNNLTLKQKISQMFILGFKGNDFETNKHFCDVLSNGLGGVIFFTHNILSEQQFKSLTTKLSQNTMIPLFFSIDQEGGRVERTENIHTGKKYLSAKYAYQKGTDFLKTQMDNIAKELKSFGINMNFAPVLDVNTNYKNPIIGERSFSSDTDEVITAAKIVYEEYEKNNIISVGKHFPGHGDSSKDSHKDLPQIDLPKEELYEKHIRPFKELIKLGIPAIMVAHVVYPNLYDEKIPSSISSVVINNILTKELNFNGIILTDDMEMNAIKCCSRFEACVRAINAGISMFIFRDANIEIIDLINDLEKAVNDGVIPINKIDIALEKILNIKRRYKIID